MSRRKMRKENREDEVLIAEEYRRWWRKMLVTKEITVIGKCSCN